MIYFRLALIFVYTLLLAACATTQPTIEVSETNSPTETAILAESTVAPTKAIVATDVPVTTEPETDDVASFVGRLQTAVIEQNYAEMEALTSDSVGVGAWRSQWRIYTPEQLITEFKNAALPAPTAVQFTELGNEEIAQLIGQPPVTMLGPTTMVAAALHSSGWGPEAMDEAILFVAKENGHYKWAAFLYTSGSFAETTNSTFPVVETDVVTVLALQDVIIYSGPGETYEEIGGVFDGQQALVTGQSPDGAWWRVICPDDTIGDCWVTADTAATEATAAPIPVSSSTPSSAAVIHNTETRTGIEDIDHLIDVVLEGDVDRLRDVLIFTTVGCTHKDGLGGPPKCREGESEGTEEEVFPFLGPEGNFLRRDEAHEWSGIEVAGLYAVYRVSENAYSEEYYPAGQFGIIFVGAQEGYSVVTQVDNGGVVRIDYVLGDSPDSKLEREAEEIILPPPSQLD